MTAIALRILLIHAIILISGCGKGGPNVAAAVSMSCPGGAVNPEGLGKPCASVQDCAGQKAVTCPRVNDPKGLDFCTQHCFGQRPGECGQGGTCAPQGDGVPALCVPSACAAKLTVAPAPAVKVRIPCSAEANALGVGKPCKTKEDCRENSVARTCPMAIRPGNPNWCSVLCTTDADCGAGAFCWKRRSNESNGAPVASCAPESCILP